MMTKHSLYWASSRLVAGLSDQLLLFAIPILVYRKTGSLSLSGFAYFLEWLPRIVSPLLAGVLVDFFCSKRVAILSDTVRCLLCLGAFLILIYAPGAPFWIYAAIAGAVGLLWETSFLAFDITLSRTSSGSELPKVQSVIQGTEQFALIFGPGIAMGIATLLNLPSVFLVSGILFFVATAVTTLTNPPARVPQTVSFKAAAKLIGDGYATILKKPLLAKLIALCLAQNIAVGLAMSLSPGYLQAGLKMPESTFGVLTMTSGLVSLAMFFALPGVLDKIGLWALCRAAALLSPAALVIMGLSKSYLPYFVGFSLLVAIDGALSIVLRTVRASIIPPERLGSVVAAMIFILNFGFPLGGALLAILAPVLGGGPILFTVAAGSALMLAITIPGLSPHFQFSRPNSQGGHDELSRTDLA